MSSSIHGYWYDGRTSEQVPAVCRVFDNGVVFVERSGDGETLATLPVRDLKASPRLADTPRFLYFPGSRKFETEQNDAVDAVLKRFGKGFWLGFVHRLESRKRYVLLSLAAMALLVWGFAAYGVPAASRLIAARLPQAVYRQADSQTLQILDRSMLGPTELEESRKKSVLAGFKPILSEHRELEPNIVFRKGKRLGPNAFALPSGTIIFTDEMVKLAEKDEELVAVLAHEIGHVKHRHGMRSVIQNSLLAFAMMAVTGDVSGTSELFIGLPVFLTQLSYSRAFEGEADRYALDYLRSHGIPTIHFAHLMRRIQKEANHRRGTSQTDWTSYLSTHPRLDERLVAFEGKGTGG